MNLNFDIALAESYHSNSQIARVLTESWVNANMYCPHCGNHHIEKFENNKPVADFFCPSCRRIFELKSKSSKIVNMINDGAYSTMIERISSKSNPDFFFMFYSQKQYGYCVNDFFIVPRYFFTPNIIIKRKPLSENARRAGWVGCNINIGAIPFAGRIYIVKQKKPIEAQKVINQLKKTNFLEEGSMHTRSWILDVMNCIAKIPKSEFTLSEIYSFEDELKLLHSSNNNIQAKIRQQLQLLRDKNIIEFLGNGKYRKIEDLV